MITETTRNQHIIPIALTYDANGNLVSGDGVYRVYNSLNQLWKVYNGSSTSGNLLQEYVFHPTEERVLIKKEFSSGVLRETTYYINKNFVRVVNSSGTYDYTYIYHEEQLIAEKLPDGTKRYYHPDLLGSTSLVTDSNGDLLSNTFYSPYGVILSSSNSSRYSYTGKEYDKTLEDYDFDARRYNAEWVKLTTADMTIDYYNPQHLNHYSYVINNPYRYTDPTGRYEEDVHLHLTEYLANQAGFTADEAREIAAANQNVDDDPRTKPDMRENYEKGITREYHFQTTGESLRRVRQSSNLEELGASLHTLQDSFAHRDYIKWAIHPPGAGVDKTAYNPIKADTMALASFVSLAQYNGLNNAQIINQWMNIYSSVRNFNQQINPKFKAQALGYSIKGESLEVGKNEYRWGKYGSGTGGYCKRNCG